MTAAPQRSDLELDPSDLVVSSTHQHSSNPAQPDPPAPSASAETLRWTEHEARAAWKDSVVTYRLLLKHRTGLRKGDILRQRLIVRTYRLAWERAKADLQHAGVLSFDEVKAYERLSQRQATRRDERYRNRVAGRGNLSDKDAADAETLRQLLDDAYPTGADAQGNPLPPRGIFASSAHFTGHGPTRKRARRTVHQETATHDHRGHLKALSIDALHKKYGWPSQQIVDDGKALVIYAASLMPKHWSLAKVHSALNFIVAKYYAASLSNHYNSVDTHIRRVTKSGLKRVYPRDNFDIQPQNRTSRRRPTTPRT